MGDFRLICATFALTLAIVSTAGCKRKSGANDGQAEVARLFDSMCASCHGRDGRGGVPAAEGLPVPRNFCDAAFQASRSDDALKKVIREGKGPMPPFGALLDDSQLTQLVVYIRGFNPKK